MKTTLIGSGICHIKDFDQVTPDISITPVPLIKKTCGKVSDIVGKY